MAADDDADTAYEAIIEGEDTGHRWAYGTGFTDPLAGVDTALPAGDRRRRPGRVLPDAGDDALIMSHRLQQWLARAPELEEETALANIALDLLGQARLLLSRAGAADGTGADRGRLRVRPDRARVPQRAAGRGQPTPTSAA